MAMTLWTIIWNIEIALNLCFLGLENFQLLFVKSSLHIIITNFKLFTILQMIYFKGIIWLLFFYLILFLNIILNFYKNIGMNESWVEALSKLRHILNTFTLHFNFEHFIDFLKPVGLFLQKSVRIDIWAIFCQLIQSWVFNFVRLRLKIHWRHVESGVSTVSW